MPDAATADAMTHEEARLLQRVRLQLALWSGGVTLVLLLLLGAVLYIAVDRSLSNSGTAQLVNQANRLTGGRPGPDRFCLKSDAKLETRNCIIGADTGFVSVGIVDE